MPAPEKPTFGSYCQFARAQDKDNVHRHHHDHQHGFPRKSDNELFEQLILEINQAGLSWDIILKKQATFRAAYADFDIDQIAAFTETDRARLLADPGIVRNRLKVNAAIDNAQRIQALRQTHDGFAGWLNAHAPTMQGKEDWVKLFKKTFRFTGGEIVNEFLMSAGYLPGAHDQDCPLYAKIAKLKPAWMATTRT